MAIPAGGATLRFQLFIDTDTGAAGAIRLLDADTGAEIIDGDFPVTNLQGVGAAWTEEPFALPAAASGKNVRIRFEFVSDDNGNLYSGFYIDDVKVIRN